MTQKILRQIKTRYKTWDRGKGKTGALFVDLLSDDATFRSIGGGVEAMHFTRPHSTREKISAYFEELIRDWQMIFYTVRLFLVDGNTIATVCECAWKHKHTGKIVHSPKLDGREALSVMAAEFAAACLDGAASASDAAAGVRIVRMLEAAQRSLEQHGARVAL